MTPGLSLYLDLLRLSAAILVAVSHLSAKLGWGDNLATAWDHEAVVIFFALSGFVVQHAVLTTDTTFARYASSRLTRLYTVIVPCLILTVLFDQVGLRLAPQVYDGRSYSEPFWRAAMTLLMLNESWQSVRPFSNVPFWSLAYEFWYYAIFAAVVFGRGKSRVALVLLTSLAAGPQVLALMPIWLLGAAARRSQLQANLPRWLVRAALLQPLVVLLIFAVSGFRSTAFALGQQFSASAYGFWLGWSLPVLSDLVFGLSIALHLLAVKGLDQRFSGLLNPLSCVIRPLAARSFTLYLLHMPLLHLLVAAAVWSGDAGWLHTGFVCLLVFAMPLALAGPFERQRHRLRPWLQRRLQRVAETRESALQTAGSFR